MKTKYVMFEDMKGVEVPFLFPDYVTHKDFARHMMSVGCTYVSAGFVDIDVDQFLQPIYRVYGESISLDLKSRPEDSKIINDMMNYQRGPE